jgi:hypothetical protein
MNCPSQAGSLSGFSTFSNVAGSPSNRQTIPHPTLQRWMGLLGRRHAFFHGQSMEVAAGNKLDPSTRSSIPRWFVVWISTFSNVAGSPSNRQTILPHPALQRWMGLLGSQHACPCGQSMEVADENKLDPSTRSSITRWFPDLLFNPN